MDINFMFTSVRLHDWRVNVAFDEISEFIRYLLGTHVPDVCKIIVVSLRLWLKIVSYKK